MHRSNRRRTLAAALLLTPAPAALAATVDWLPTAPTPAPFSDPSNWSTNAVPSPTDAARFDTGSPHTVTLTADTSTDQLLVANDALTLDLAGHTYTLASLASATPDISLGSPAGSSLTLLNSASFTLATLSAVQFVTSPNAGDTSSLTLTAGTALAGYSVPGTAYATFTLAKAGTGLLSLTGGARLDTTGGATLAQDPGSSATLSLAGPGTLWTAGTSKVGSRGTADVQITGGAAMNTPSGFLRVGSGITPAHTNSGSITVDGPGSALSAVDAYVGEYSRGILTVRNGASAAVTNQLYLGYAAGSSGTFTVATGAAAMIGRVYVGGTNTAAAGTGTINVQGGSLTVGSVTLWNSPGTSINLDGGSLKLANLTTDSDPSRFRWTGGSLELTNSAFQVSNPTTVTPALNAILNAGPTVSLTAGMALKLSSAPSHANYLVIDNGGTLSADGASVSLSDVAFVGYAATGTLALTNHASMSSPGGTIGYYSLATGTIQRGTGIATLDDHATWTLTGDLAVGGDGGGTLAVRGASAVSDVNATIAAGPIASSAAVDGPGSSWSSSGTLTVGKLGQGNLTISNGGAASSTTAIIGSSRTPDASAVTIQGPGSSWTNTTTLYVAGGQTSNTSRTPAALSLSDHASLTTRTLAVGTNSANAAGSVTLASGATVAVTASAYLGGISTPRGTANLSLTDSSATVGTTLKLWDTPNTSLSLTRSTLTIGTPAAPGALDNAASISLADHSTLTLHGTLANTGTLTLSPDSLLLWAPAATTPDPLSTLRTQLATSRILPSPAAPANYRPAYTVSGEPAAPTSLTITLALTGDTNLDGRIDPDDYTLLDRSYARPLTNALWTDGDFNYDGIIDNQDYLLIDTAYGQAQGFSPGFLSHRESQFGADYVSQLLTSIPEPTPSSILYPLSSLLLLRQRRRPR